MEMQKLLQPEKREYTDAKTGRKVVQLTNSQNPVIQNRHLYFTDNSFTTGDGEIIFTSNRLTERADEHQLFRMDLETGSMELICEDYINYTIWTKSPDSEIIVFLQGKKVYALNTVTGVKTLVYEEIGDFTIASPFISPDKKYVGFARNEVVQKAHNTDYSNFDQTMCQIKKAYITIAYLDGSKHFDVHESTHWMGHFQFSPDDPTIATFCHEGPWNLVMQRIWLLDLVSRSVAPCYRQNADDCVGHEFWTKDGLVFFDNRGKGHDGTITKSRKQALIQEESSAIPIIGFADKSGKVLRTLEMSFYCNHYHGNNDNTLLVGDAVDDLYLIDISTDKPKMEVLAHHGSSWVGYHMHPHPTFSWDNGKILYATDKDGGLNLYMLEM